MSQRRLKVLLLTEEDTFYLPLSIAHILAHSRHDIEHVCCLRNPTTESTLRTVKTFVGAFGVGPLARHAARLVRPKLMDLLPGLNGADRHWSVRRAVAAAGRSCRWVDNVNGKAFLAWAADLAPDLIISVSPTQIFKKRLLAIAPLGCLNVHSSLLPMYRGLYPVFWAMAAGETELGVSVHYIDEGIDTGDVVLQDAVPTAGMQTMDEALLKTKLLGARLMCEAMDQVAAGMAQRHALDLAQGSYHSFPDREAYRRFQARGYRLW